MIELLISEIEQQMRDYLAASAVRANANHIGLDGRAGTVYVTNEAIIREGHPGSLEYYGGFEYVDREFVHNIGQYRIYLKDDERVAGCIEYFQETQGEKY